MRFDFLGKPVAKKRHRTGNGHTYDPQSELKKRMEVEALYQVRERMMTGPVKMRINAWFRRPKSHYRSVDKQPVLKESAPNYHTSKPDADNIAKFYKDVLSGIAYEDDRQVCDLRVVKKYSGTFEGVSVEIV